MRIVHLALGGCLTAPPIRFGVTEDTGGHIAYVLGAAAAQARRRDVTSIDIVTRRFHDPALGTDHDLALQALDPKTRIVRLASASTRYLEKEPLEAELPSLEASFLRYLAETPRPDVIHAHFADAAQLAAAAHARYGIRWVYTPHSLGIEKLTCTSPSLALQRRITRERAAIRRAHAIIVSSRDEAERQVEAYDADAAGRTHRVNPGVDVSGPVDLSRAHRILNRHLAAPAQPFVLAVARPVRKKNLSTLLDAYAGSKELQDRANLVIVAGQWDHVLPTASESAEVLRDLVAKVERHRLSTRVALPPAHVSEDVRALYAVAAERGVFANPALHEPFGLTVVEAAQMGVPVVATDRGGPIDITREIAGGQLVDPHDPKAIAAACLRALNDPQRTANAARVRLNAMRVYNWDQHAAAVTRIYRTPARATHRAISHTSLFASDMDGTLTGDRSGAAMFDHWLKTHPRTLFVLATGRSIGEARRVLHDWTLPEPDICVTSVGTEIWERGPDGHLSLCPEYADDISQCWPRDAVQAALAASGLQPQAPYEQRRWKLSYLGTDADADRARAVLARAGLLARVIASHGRFIDVVPLRGGKGAALRFLARRAGISREQTIAAGDSGNDADLLTAAGFAIMPANALPELLAERIPTFKSRLPYVRGVLDGLSRAPALRLTFSAAE